MKKYLWLTLHTLIYFLYVNGIDFLIAYKLDQLNKTEYYFTISTYGIYLPALAVLLYLLKDEFGKKHRKLNIGFLVSSLLIIPLFRIFEDPFFRLQNIIYNEPLPPLENGFDFIFLNEMNIFLGTVLLIPLVEELFFRKYLISYLLREKTKVIPIVLFTSLMFSLMHYSFPNLFLSFMLGVVLSILYLKTKSIIYPLLVHCGYNFLWYIIRLNTNEYWEVIRFLRFNIFYWILFALAILGLIYIIKSLYRIGVESK